MGRDRRRRLSRSRADIGIVGIRRRYGILIDFAVSSNSGISSETFKVATGIYLIVAAMLSSTIGGYVAGRLRTKWTGLHSDEVAFRDTAHGFLAWAFATPRTRRERPRPKRRSG